ncbi:unnamed protein product [Penicillium camemberti]|uniref:Str. FM013 n=1 Tax=Penicillium camemberti (strain FM 013) TaxID=1429867 RepID=A0A0G4PL95_PENC3|nr:unnamed protein product [Penicillium camemberti]
MMLRLLGYASLAHLHIILVLYPPIGLSVQVPPPICPLYVHSRKYVMTSGPNVGGARLCKVLAGLEIVLPAPGRR